MGEAKRRRQILGEKYGQSLSTKEVAQNRSASELLQQNSFQDDLTTLITSLCINSPDFLQTVWKHWQDCSSKAGHGEFIMVSAANMPGKSKDILYAMPASELPENRERLGVSPSSERSLLRMLEMSSDAWYLPPMLALWFDGKPDGEFVSQAVCLLKEKE